MVGKEERKKVRRKKGRKEGWLKERKKE